MKERVRNIGGKKYVIHSDPENGVRRIGEIEDTPPNRHKVLISIKHPGRSRRIIKRSIKQGTTPGGRPYLASSDRERGEKTTRSSVVYGKHSVHEHGTGVGKTSTSARDLYRARPKAIKKSFTKPE